LIILASEAAAPAERPQALEERWILARLSQTQREIERLLGEFDFSHVVDELYHLTFDDFCDWYAEAIKPRLYDGDRDGRATALAALARLLKRLPRGNDARPLRRPPRRARDGSRRPRAAAEAAPPGDAARHRGDLDEPARARV